jgi:hypothetical protein
MLRNQSLTISAPAEANGTYYLFQENVVEVFNYTQNKIVKHVKYEYDQDDNKIKEEAFDSSGNKIESSVYKYENGLRIEKIVFDSFNKVKSRKLY